MIVEVRTVPQGRSVKNQTLNSFGEGYESLQTKSGIVCTAEIDRNDARMVAKIMFTGEVECECARCCKKFYLPLDGEYIVLIEQGDVKKNGSSGDKDVFYYRDETDMVDTRPVLYDEIMTMIPMKPLCEESCSGIQLDGIQRETDETIDPRWDALRKLKHKK
jgi:uncharacterized metal-binding protein YceD (DUF177 family)